MKVTFDREQLADALGVAVGIIPAKTPKPVLQNVKVVATAADRVGGACRVDVSATDLESGVRLAVRGVVVERSGSCLVPAQKLLAIVKELTDSRLVIEASADAVTVSTLGSEFELPTAPVDEFPDIPDLPAGDGATAYAGHLRQLASRVMFAAGKENVRYALGGVLWEMAQDKLTLVGTDTRRLAIADGVVTGNPGANNVIIPSRAMNLLARTLDEGLVRFYFGVSEAMFAVSGIAGQSPDAGDSPASDPANVMVTVYTRIMDGRYPPYRQVLPKDVKTTVTMTAGPLLAGVRQAAILTDDAVSKGVEFAFVPGILTLTSRIPDRGRSRVGLACDFKGKDVAVTLQPQFVTEFLKGLSGDQTVHIHLTNGASAILMTVGDNYQYVIMPITGKE